MLGKLSIVATPIGNLADITDRARETLAAADFILCEDTRVTKKLLSHYAIQTPTKSYHQHSTEKHVKEILSLLEDGKHLALVTDAGTPGISDPGNHLIHAVIARSEGRATWQSPGRQQHSYVAPAPRNDEITIVPIPGPSAVVAALSISGFPTDKFIFMGFPPHKTKRKKFFEEVRDAKYTVAFYESSHRIHKALENLAAVLQPGQQIMIARELTKKFESIYRGTISELQEMDMPAKGEFVIVVNSKR